MKPSRWVMPGLVLIFLAFVGVQTLELVRAPQTPTEQDQAGRPMGGSQSALPAGAMAAKAPLVPPESLASLRLSNVVTGPQALQEFAQLHGRDFDLLNGYVAHYGDSAILWVGQARDVTIAFALVEQMTQRINEGRSPFSLPQKMQVATRTIYATVGLGQQHYYFQANEKVVWLAVDAAKASEVLHAALSTIR